MFVPFELKQKLNQRLGTFDDDIILLQYTGLKDKFKIRIFEGDIVEFDCPEGLIKQQVIFNRGAFTTKSGRMWGFEGGTENLMSYEVIGNIYEDIDLLELLKEKVS